MLGIEEGHLLSSSNEILCHKGKNHKKGCIVIRHSKPQCFLSSFLLGEADCKVAGLPVSFTFFQVHLGAQKATGLSKYRFFLAKANNG